MNAIKQLMAAQTENSYLKEQILESYDFKNIIGTDGELRQVIEY